MWQLWTTDMEGGAPGRSRRGGGRRKGGGMRFDTKIAIVVRGDLAAWQRLNVTAFLASGIAAGWPARPSANPTRTGQVTVIWKCSASRCWSTRRTGRAWAWSASGLAAREMPVAVYTEDMFTTGHDEANRAVVREVAASDLRLAGVAVYGPRNAVDKVCKGLALHS